MTRPLRVLHVLDRSLPVVAGYTQRARAILHAQRSAGHDPVPLTSARQGGNDDEHENVDGFVHYRTRLGPALAPLGRAPVAREIAEMLALGKRALTVGRAAAVDVVHAHSPVLCGVPAHLAARRLGIPSVYEIRAFWEDAAQSRADGRPSSARYAATRAIETELARSADAVVALCGGIRDDLVARGVPSDRVFVVPNGVATDRFAPRPADPALADRLGLRGTIVIAYVGTLFRFEGVATLLDAIAALAPAHPEVRALIVGAGEAAADLHRRRAALGLEQKVVMTGSVPPGDVPAYYAAADIVCFPRERSRITELTTPLKPLEAMSMGKAVVGSDVGGIRELLRDRDTGFMFRAGDTDDLVRVLEQLVGDVELRNALGARARADVLATRDWHRIAARYDEVYATARDNAVRRRQD